MTGQDVVKLCNEKMGKAIEATKHKFTSIRAGRASVSMLDSVRVEQYGSEMPLNQVGSVSAPEARLLVIDPWDKSLISKIENTTIPKPAITACATNNIGAVNKKENSIGSVTPAIIDAPIADNNIAFVFILFSGFAV